MGRSLCILVLCTNEQPAEVMRTLQMCVWLRNQHPALGDGLDRTGAVKFCHMDITQDASGNVRLGKWKECVDFCRSNWVGVIPLVKDELLSPYLTSALTLAMLEVEVKESFDALLLVDGSAYRSALGNTSAEAIWRAVEALYGQPEVWMLISKSRQFALMRSSFFRRWYPMYFASEGRTCRRTSLLSPFGRKGKIWVLEPRLSPDNAYEYLSAIFHGMDAVGVLDGYLSWKLAMYRIETKLPERYTLLDFLWMLELCVRVRGIPFMILPIAAKTWTPEGIKTGALLHAPESIGLPTMSGARFLMAMLALPFLGVVLGTIVGARLGDWRAGGFYGLTFGAAIAAVGQFSFFRRNR
ncbi:MAG: hypothetical protein NTZ17_04750 [Phycisphaerae bacterium]|nr:hypothetical protein [Phycisphaerae bacterium]